MASTNEDVVVLATAPLGETRQLLVVRHLPDRGSVELGWWEESGGAVVPGPSVIEFAAEAVEIDAVARLCDELRAGGRWGAAGEGEVLAESPPFVDGARVAAVRAGDGVRLVRRPEGGELALPSQAALALLAGLFPAALRQLEALGFGLVQQGDDEGRA
jgi:hypothetical protein